VTDAATVVNHWTEMSEWWPGRTLFACYLTFETRPELHQVVTAYQGALADLPGLDLIWQEWLHLTVQGIAFTDELDPGQAARLAAAVRDELAVQPACALTLQRPLVGNDGVYLPVAEPHSLAAVRGAVAAAAARTLTPRSLYALPGQADGEFVPHVSIAYGNGDVPRETVVDRLSRVDVPLLTLRVDSVSMMNLRRDHRRWSWTDTVKIPFGEA
jgi:2'-5' RNA ligase